MKRTWTLIPFALAAIGAMWLVADAPVRARLANMIGFTPPAPVAVVAQQKPICSQSIVPTGADCIPQHMAKLPPDPGEAGKATIDGIDSDKDGVRDDVQRYIAENFGDSARAVRILTMVAQSKQLQVHHGGDLGKDETKKLVPKIINTAVCYTLTETPALQDKKAFRNVQIQVTNTPERWLRAEQFNDQLAHDVYDMPEHNVPEVCGFNPDSLPN